jgi:hypothetical protein
MATEEDRQEERDRMDNDPIQAPPAEALDEENPVDSPAEPGSADDEPHPEERAATSMEFPSNVTRSTQDLTVGGSEKEPTGGGDSPSRRGNPDEAQETEERDQGDRSADGLSTAEQAVDNQDRALQSGEESPG